MILAFRPWQAIAGAAMLATVLAGCGTPPVGASQTSLVLPGVTNSVYKPIIAIFEKSAGPIDGPTVSSGVIANLSDPADNFSLSGCVVDNTLDAATPTVTVTSAANPAGAAVTSPCRFSVFGIYRGSCPNTNQTNAMSAAVAQATRLNPSDTSLLTSGEVIFGSYIRPGLTQPNVYTMVLSPGTGANPGSFVFLTGNAALSTAAKAGMSTTGMHIAASNGETVTIETPAQVVITC
jgi:hypothetical protein